jgi:hypothetical protein
MIKLDQIPAYTIKTTQKLVTFWVKDFSLTETCEKLIF